MSVGSDTTRWHVLSKEDVAGEFDVQPTTGLTAAEAEARLAQYGPNRFTARVQSQHYQGTQTVYEVTVLGTRIEALEVGSSARWDVGAEVTVALPPEMCWGYGG